MLLTFDITCIKRNLYSSAQGKNSAILAKNTIEKNNNSIFQKLYLICSFEKNKNRASYYIKCKRCDNSVTISRAIIDFFNYYFVFRIVFSC